MSGHTMFHVFLDVLFIANIALFFYLLHKKNNPPGRIPRSEWPRPTDRVVDHKKAQEFFMTCVNSRRKGVDLIEKLEWENYFNEVTRSNPNITWEEILVETTKN